MRGGTIPDAVSAPLQATPACAEARPLAGGRGARRLSLNLPWWKWRKKPEGNRKDTGRTPEGEEGPGAQPPRRRVHYRSLVCTTKQLLRTTNESFSITRHQFVLQSNYFVLQMNHFLLPVISLYYKVITS